MAKSDVVSAGVAAIQSAESQALSDQLGIAYDAGVSDQKGIDGSAPGQFTQNDIDNAVAAAKAVDAQALTDSQAADAAALAGALANDSTTAAQALSDSNAALAKLQASLDAMTAKDAADVSAMASFQTSIAAAQANLSAIEALFNPAPVAPSVPVSS